MLTLFLCGDVMTGRAIDQILPRPADPMLSEPYVRDARQYVALAERRYGPIAKPVDPHYVWGFAIDRLAEINPAARVINLETAVTTSDQFWRGKGIHYRMAPANVACLMAAQPDCCTLANNHVLDWGHAGLDETLRSLHAAGIPTAGAGRTAAEARCPVVIETAHGPRLRVFGVAAADSGVPSAWAAAEDRPGVWRLDDFSEPSAARLVDAVAAARLGESDLVVVSIHWGGNWGYEVSAGQRALAHRLIEEAGVSVVHGHSSHHVKGIEVHRGRLILYGCGDLITDYEGISGHERFRGDLGLMYLPTIDAAGGRLEALSLVPTQMRRLQLRRPPRQDVVWLHEMLNREGRRFGSRVRLAADDTLRLQWPA